MSRPKLEDWSIATALNVNAKKDDEDQKITDPQQVIKVYQDCPPGYRAVLPSKRFYKDPRNWFIVRIELRKMAVKVAEEELKDHEAMKDPRELAKRKFAKAKNYFAKMMAALKEFDIDPNSINLDD